MLRTPQLTLAATQQRLSDAYGVSSRFPAGTPNPTTDIPLRQIIVQAAAAAAYIGEDPATLSTSVYGYTIASGGAVTLGPFDTGPMKLSDFYALGSGATLHITAIPY